MTPPERATKSAGRRAGAGARGGAARGRGQRRAPARRGKRHAPHAVDGCARAARATRPRRRSMRAAYARPIPSRSRPQWQIQLSNITRRFGEGRERGFARAFLLTSTFQSTPPNFRGPWRLSKWARRRAGFRFGFHIPVPPIAFYIDSRSRRFTTSRRGVALRLARTSPE
jgi:hypothetical protein